MLFKYLTLLALVASGMIHEPLFGGEIPLELWKSYAPRPEIEPEMTRDTEARTLSICADKREGLQGGWRVKVPVQGGQHYKFSVGREAFKVNAPRRSAVVRITWLGDGGKKSASFLCFSRKRLEWKGTPAKFLSY